MEDHRVIALSPDLIRPNDVIVEQIISWTFLRVVSLHIFKSLAVFWRSRRASQNTKDKGKFTAKLHTKMSNKRFVIVIQCFFSQNAYSMLCHSRGQVREIWNL